MVGMGLASALALVACGGADVDHDAWRREFHDVTERELGGFEDTLVVDPDVDLTDDQIDRLVAVYCEPEGPMAGMYEWERKAGVAAMFPKDKLTLVTAAYAATAETAQC